MKSKIKNIIKNGLEKYDKKEIEILDKKHSLYIVPELSNEDLNIFDGFLLVYSNDEKEISYLKTKYKPSSGYCARLGFIFYNDHLLIKDFRANKHIIKDVKKINQAFQNKIKKALSKPNEENLSKLFDRTDIIDEFYILWKKAREFLLKNIKGINEEDKRGEFVDNFMMQMLTLWYLQEKRFFNNDKNYFITKFNELKENKFKNDFKSFYEFLKYFFRKISGFKDNQYIYEPKIGEVVVIGPAIFLNGEYNNAISIPDKCFYQKEKTKILLETPPKNISDDVPLLNLFESRDWTEGNIDEFVLGAIYEKLITSQERKETGAYYTPEEITSYICENTIKPYLIDRVNEEFKKEFKSIDQIIENNNEEILLFLFNKLKDIKILDPAVGSGHFLESAINVLVYIYEKIWEKAKNIKNKFEIITVDEKGNLKPIDLANIPDENKFKLLIKFFIILSQNIYGVDINPSALKVARARLFLTLAKHFKVGNNNIFIRFPNVHFNLREGNSLIGYVKLDKKKEQRTIFDLNEKQKEYVIQKIKISDELKSYLENIAKSLKINGDVAEEVTELNQILSKKKITWKDFKKILHTKEKLVKILIVSLNSKYTNFLHKLLNQITDLFNQKLDEKFAEEFKIDLDNLKETKTFHWIFEFPEVFLKKSGFDVVVGNPPYIDSENMSKDAPVYRKFINTFYKAAKGNWDIFCVFIERSLCLNRDKGYFSMIVPNKLLSSEYSKYIKEIILKYRILNIRDYSKVALFPANVYPIVILLYLTQPSSNWCLTSEVIEPHTYKSTIENKIFQSNLDYNHSWSFIFQSNDEIEIIDYIQKISIHLKKITDIYGAATVNEAYKIKDFIKENTKNYKYKDYFIFVNSGIIDRFSILWDSKKIKYIKEQFEKPVINKNKLKELSEIRYNQALKPKIIIAGLTKIIEAYYDIGICLAAKSTTIIFSDKKFKYLTLILNSKLLTYFFRKYYKSLSLQSGYLRIAPPQIKEIPIINKIKFKTKTVIEIFTDYLLFLNSTLEDKEKFKYIREYFDHKIGDSLIYELYFNEKFKEDNLYDEPKEYLFEAVSKHLKPISYDQWADLYWKKQIEGNLSSDEEKELKEIEKDNINIIEKVYNSLKQDEEIKKWIDRIKSHKWVKIIENEIEGDTP